MARKLRTKKGRATYARRKTIVEPVFGQLDTVQDARRLLLRGKQAARAQWRFHCAIHNLLKLHRAGGPDLISEQNSPQARNRRPLAMLATVIYSLTACFRRSLATIPAVASPGSHHFPLRTQAPSDVRDVQSFRPHARLRLDQFHSLHRRFRTETPASSLRLRPCLPRTPIGVASRPTRWGACRAGVSGAVGERSSGLTPVDPC